MQCMYSQNINYELNMPGFAKKPSPSYYRSEKALLVNPNGIRRSIFLI